MLIIGRAEGESVWFTGGGLYYEAMHEGEASLSFWKTFGPGNMRIIEPIRLGPKETIDVRVTDTVTLQVGVKNISTSSGHVTLWFDGPKEVSILRSELLTPEQLLDGVPKEFYHYAKIDG